MYAACFAALLFAGQTQGTDQPTRHGPEGMTSLDGNWTVVCLEKNGQPVADAHNMTVTIRNNTVTFNDPKQNNKMRSMKLEFGPRNMVRVEETDGVSTSEKRRDDADRGAGRGNDRSGTAGHDEMKRGVYVMTHDFLTLCVHDDQGTGGDRNRGERGDRTDRGGRGDRAGGEGRGETANMQPQAKSYCTVILRRSGAATGRGE